MSFIEIVKSDYNLFETDGSVFYEEYYKILPNQNRDEEILKIIPKHSLEKVYLYHILSMNMSEYNKLYELGKIDIDFLLDKYELIKRDTINNISLYGIPHHKNYFHHIYLYFKGNLSAYEKLIYFLDDIHTISLNEN